MGTPIYRNFTKAKEADLATKPHVLWQEACIYFKWVDDNPFKKEQNMVVDKKVKLTETKHQRPYTWTGLCLYLKLPSDWFRWKRQEWKSLSPVMQEVIEMITTCIHENKYTGAAVGAFNANLIIRDLGMAEKVDQTNKNFNAVNMTKEEVKEINQYLEEEY